MVRPGVDAKPWRKSATENFPQTFNTYLDASGISECEMGLMLEVSSVAINNYRKGEFLPNLERVQIVADTFGIEVGDLFLRPRKDVKTSISKRREEGVYKNIVEAKKSFKGNYDGLITHRAFLAINVIKAMRTHGVQYHKNKIAVRIAKGQTVRLDEIENLVRRYGVSIGNAFLKPGIKTSWYDESRAIYMAENVILYRTIKGWGREDLANNMSRCSLATLINIENGLVFATLAQAQGIATALEVEISDLFLPVDGLD